MSTQALPHEAIGVPQYAWSTSPLRRYVDMVNQWQLIAAVEHGVSARLIAPFKPKDADLFAIIGAFDAQYAAWSDYQNAMERYWCLRWLKQNNVQRTTAHVLRDDLLRLAHAPLVTRVGGMPTLARGTEVEVEIMGADEFTLELDIRFVAEVPQASTDPQASAAVSDADSTSDSSIASSEDEPPASAAHPDATPTKSENGTLRTQAD